VVDCTKLSSIIGSSIKNAWIGVGSFLVIDFSSVDRHNSGSSIWAYLCDWALTIDGVEVLSSDSRSDSDKLRQLDGLELLSCVLVDHEEFHLDFSENVRLEVWENKELYGVNAEALKIYQNGAYTTSIVF